MSTCLMASRTHAPPTDTAVEPTAEGGGSGSGLGQQFQDLRAEKKRSGTALTEMYASVKDNK